LEIQDVSLDDCDDCEIVTGISFPGPMPMAGWKVGEGRAHGATFLLEPFNLYKTSLKNSTPNFLSQSPLLFHPKFPTLPIPTFPPFRNTFALFRKLSTNA